MIEEITSPNLIHFKAFNELYAVRYLLSDMDVKIHEKIWHTATFMPEICQKCGFRTDSMDLLKKHQIHPECKEFQDRVESGWTVY